MSSEKPVNNTPEVSAYEAELERFRKDYAIEESDDPRTLDGSLVPDYLAEYLEQPMVSAAEVAALGKSAVEQKVGLPALPAEFFYDRNISQLRSSDIYRTENSQFDLRRPRNSFETKQDVILSVATIFVNYSSEGSGLGYLTQHPEDKLESSGRSKNYNAARDYIISFLAEVKSRLPEGTYRNARGENLPIAGIISNALAVEDVNWFGPGYAPKQETVAGGRKRFEDKFSQKFATLQVYKEGTRPKNENMAKIRKDYLSSLSKIVQPELKQRKAEKK